MKAKRELIRSKDNVDDHTIVENDNQDDILDDTIIDNDNGDHNNVVDDEDEDSNATKPVARKLNL
jgi:hypothetical protein